MYVLLYKLSTCMFYFIITFCSFLTIYDSIWYLHVSTIISYQYITYDYDWCISFNVNILIHEDISRSIWKRYGIAHFLWNSVLFRKEDFWRCLHNWTIPNYCWWYRRRSLLPVLVLFWGFFIYLVQFSCLFDCWVRNFQKTRETF
jgi:hypothetical protein